MEDKKCTDEGKGLQSGEAMIEVCLRSIAHERFASYIAPTFVMAEFELLDIDIDEYGGSWRQVK